MSHHRWVDQGTVYFTLHRTLSQLGCIFDLLEKHLSHSVVGKKL